MDWQGEVLGFWFGLKPEQWWKADPQLDTEIRERFLDLWERERENVPEAFLGSPRDAVAAVTLFDQFPRNMLRGHADQFSTDPLALAIAKGAVARGLDDRMSPEERGFLYVMVLLRVTELVIVAQRGEEGNGALLVLKTLAVLERHVIARFGRFPHRNPILGRKPRADEIAAGDVVPW